MARLLRGGDVDDIREMHQQGLSITGIAELTGFDRKTVRKWLTARPATIWAEAATAEQTGPVQALH